MFDLIVISLIVWLMSGCSHVVVSKRCAKVDDSQYKERSEQSVCDSLWFWE